MNKKSIVKKKLNLDLGTSQDNLPILNSERRGSILKNQSGIIKGSQSIEL
jgi:hypothetical protein